MKTFLDWSAYDTYGIGDAYSGIPATGGNYAKAVAVCMHSRDCHSTGKGVMCPSFRITNDKLHSTEARVAAFKAALNDGNDATAFADPRLDAAMDLCVSCKACKKECPSSVDMTLIKTEYLAQRHEIKGVPRRTFVFGSVPMWTGRHRNALRFAIWLRNHFKLAALAAEKWLGITSKRPLPAPAPKAFDNSKVAGTGENGEVILFVDTFCHHFDPEIAEAATEILVKGGYRVRFAKPAENDAEPDRPLCCGRTYLTTGMVDKAKGEGRRVLNAFKDEIEKKTPIIGLEPSCLLSLRDELYSLGFGQETGDLGKQLYLLEEFLVREATRGIKFNWKAVDLPKATRKVLGWIPGFKFDVVETSCCGMAGSFGLEAEHYEPSMQMAEIALLPAVRGSAEDTPILANGFSCRHQIAHGTGRKSVHIATLLRDALA